jgi:hypothetical protein
MKDVMRVVRLALAVLALAFAMAAFLYFGNRNRPLDETAEDPAAVQSGVNP